MKNLFACLAMLAMFTSSGQTSAPWNPDSNNDDLITTSDLLQVLNVFGEPFIADCICPDLQGELDSLTNLVDILNGYDLFGCTDTAACNFDPYANASDGNCQFFDLCGICGGDDSTCDSCEADICLWMEGNTVFFSSTVPFAGFQFNHTCETIPPVCCGPDGWPLFSGPAAILSYDMTLAGLDGSGPLFTFTSDVCIDFEQIIFSDPSGNEISDIEAAWE